MKRVSPSTIATAVLFVVALLVGTYVAIRQAADAKTAHTSPACQTIQVVRLDSDTGETRAECIHNAPQVPAFMSGATCYYMDIPGTPGAVSLYCQRIDQNSQVTIMANGKPTAGHFAVTYMATSNNSEVYVSSFVWYPGYNVDE